MSKYIEFDERFVCVKIPWKVKKTKHFEGVMTQGSGYMYLRASYEEGILVAPQD